MFLERKERRREEKLYSVHGHCVMLPRKSWFCFVFASGWYLLGKPDKVSPHFASGSKGGDGKMS